MTLFGSGHTCEVLRSYGERSQRQNLMAMIDQLGTAHCNFTLSSADMQCPDLQAYLHQFSGVQPPSAAVAPNSMLSTWFMHERV